MSDTSSGEKVTSPKLARRRIPLRAIAVASAFVAVIAALVLVVYSTSHQEYEMANPPLEPQPAPARDSTVKSIASAPATPRPPIAATPVATVAPARVMPSVRPVTVRHAVADAASTPAGKAAKIVTATPAPTPVVVAAAPVESHDAEKATTAREDAAPTEIARPVAVPAATAAVDAVTITGCLEIARDEDRYRLVDTEGASTPQARSWRSGFLKKRSTPVDLTGSADTLSLHRQVGQRVAATGVLTSRTLNVSSVRVVAPSCN